MPVQENQVVTINYTLKDDNGNIIDSTYDNKPFSFLSGNDQILPELEKEIGSMIIGSNKSVKLPPEKGYGSYKEEAVQTVKREEFPNDVELDVGMSFMANTPEGKRVPFTVNKIEGDEVTIDFNHPLAGKTLNFDVELVDVRNASAEELAHGHVHGPDGHSH